MFHCACNTMPPIRLDGRGRGCVCDINNGFIICCTAATTHRVTLLSPSPSLSLSMYTSLLCLLSLSLFTLSVHPVIQVPNQLVGAPLGTDVQIECHVEASPKSINYWIKDTGECVCVSLPACVCVCVVKHHKFSIL